MLVLAILLALQAQGQSDARTSCTHDVFTAYCNSSGLPEVPADIPIQTKKLYLGDNNISSISDQFVTTDCGDLRLQWNFTDESLSHCSRLPYLYYLDVSNNQIRQLSRHFIFGMTQLLFLDIRNNKLETLHQDTFYFSRLLVFVDISENFIQYIPSTLFQNLRHLKFLHIHNNLLRNLDSNTFVGLDNLHVLSMHINFITDLDHGLFRDLHNLTVLRVQHNRLSHLSEEVIDNAINLKILNASYNDITFLSSTMFSNNKLLLEVDFSHNRIRKLTKHTMQKLIKFNVVNFSFNYLKFLYLSYLPVSLHKEHSLNILKTDKNVCENNLEDNIPCFLREVRKYFRDKLVSHSINFSFNRITQIIFSSAKIAHTLEILQLSLSGNSNLSFPIPFIKKESTITSLDLSETNLSWKNLTLFDSILNLPHLRTLNIVGCEACEYFTRSELFVIFNFNLRVEIKCGDNTRKFNTVNILDNSRTYFASVAKGLSSKEFQETLNATDFANDGFFEEDLHNISTSPCDFIMNPTRIFHKFGDVVFNVDCAYVTDCSYSTIYVLPKLTLSTQCILFSHNIINYMEKDYFSFNENTVFLDLSYNKLYELPDKLFANLKTLKILRLDNNKLTDLSSRLFDDLFRIEFLSLHGNNIVSYTPDTFATLKGLKLLTVFFKDINSFLTETLKYQINLTLLEVHGQGDLSSQLNIFKSSFCSFQPRLMSLKLVGFNLSASFTNISDTFICLSFLKRISLENNICPVLYGNTFQGSNHLVTLKFKGNGIRLLEKQVFKNLTKLSHLDLSFNQISVLHSDLFLDLTQLFALDISHNKITSLPLSIFRKMFSLISLNLSYNCIIGVDLHIFSNMPSLNSLSLDNNEAKIYLEQTGSVRQMSQHSNTQNIFNRTVIPGDGVIWENQLITEINLCNTSIVTVTEYMFMNLTDILSLFLSNSQIIKIDDNAFVSTVKLQLLYLDHNFLKVINKKLFRNLVNLEKLYLLKNRLKFIESGAFISLYNLVYIDISFNMLTMFDSKSLPAENRLSFLVLQDNLIVSNKSDFSQLHLLRSLYLNNNIFLNVTASLFRGLSNLIEMHIANTTTHELSKMFFQNHIKLRSIHLNDNCLQKLAIEHFSPLRYLAILDLGTVTSVKCGIDSGLSWKNMTLLNYFFELPYLDQITLTGNSICDEVQRKQIIENLYLSWKFIRVICSEKGEEEQLILSKDGLTFTF
ncbi:protein artichoke-like [Bacillus rossius redtenbacheri]|uniref:protein artichoke-like n=1 Tax=Bacillus rossius redtenbacheri TaxID=93214 RepID=UPI002FDEAF3A